MVKTFGYNQLSIIFPSSSADVMWIGTQLQQQNPRRVDQNTALG